MCDLADGYTITDVAPEDIPALIAVDRAASKLFVPTGLIRPEALFDHVPAAEFETAIEDKRVFAARDAFARPIGFVLNSQRSKTGLYLDQISVHPDHGQKGIGRQLVMRAIVFAEELKVPHITLSTFRDLPWNGPFYARLGFKEIPRNKYEPYMHDIEAAQTPLMDVSARCFMRRSVRRGLFSFRR